MKINIEEIKDKPLNRERLAYDGRTGNRIDVEVYLSPLRAVYKVGKEGGESVNFFDNLDSAVDKFNSLEQQDKRTCETCGVTQDSYCNECEEYNRWFRKETGQNEIYLHHCKLCGAYIEEDNLRVCDKCASEYRY